MNPPGIATMALVVGLGVGAGATALGYELSGRSDTGHNCADIRRQLRQVSATANLQIGGGASHANSVREAALVLAYPTCFSAAQNTAAYNQMQAEVRIG